MRKLKSIAVLLLSCVLAFGVLLTSGCTIMSGGYSEREILESNLLSLISCMENGDRVGVKNLFAPNIVAAQPDFDAQVEKLIEYYDGEFEMYFGSPGGGSGSNHYGDREEFTSVIYTIVTTKEIYNCNFTLCTVFSSDSKNVGIWDFGIIKHSENLYPDFDYGETGGNGIFVGINRDPAEYKFNEIIAELEADNFEDLTTLFNYQIRNEDEAFSDKVNALLDMYDGEYISHERTAQEIDVVYGKNGFIARRFFNVSYDIVTTTSAYSLAFRFCYNEILSPYDLAELGENEQEDRQYGINSLYITKKTTSTPTPYLGDGLWSIGIHIE